MAACGKVTTPMILIMIIGCCGAVPGTSILESAVLRIATAIIRATGTTTFSVFVLSVRPRGLCNPLLFCPFPFFFSLFPPQAGNFF